MNEPMDKGIEAGEAGARETKNAVLEVFQALSHPVRLEICQLLMARQFSVSELCVDAAATTICCITAARFVEKS